MGLRPTNGDESAQGPVMLSAAKCRSLHEDLAGNRHEASAFLHLQKQILRFLESDGLHRSPEIGLRRFAPQNERVGLTFDGAVIRGFPRASHHFEQGNWGDGIGYVRNSRHRLVRQRLKHPQFANPDTNSSSPTFGVVSSTAVNAHVGQVALKFSF
jgi:hypothetical protein